MNTTFEMTHILDRELKANIFEQYRLINTAGVKTCYLTNTFTNEQ